MPSQAVWVASVETFRGEKRQIPILDHIPPEGVGRVDKREDESGKVRYQGSLCLPVETHKRRMMVLSLYM